MTHLSTLDLLVLSLETNITRNTLYPLRKLPLRELSLGWSWAHSGFSISKDVFSPLTSNITRFQTTFTTLLSITSLQYPCHTLILTYDKSRQQVVDSSSLQVFQKWNATLEVLVLSLVFLETVEDYAFIWISNLHVLDLGINKINYLARYAFYGLNSLEQLILSDNSLTSIPSDALEVFRKYGSLQYLDLSSNRISQRIDQDAFSAVATSLLHLNLDIRYRVQSISTNWISLLQNLKHLTLTCNNDLICGIHIASGVLLPSLQTIQIINIDTVVFETPLCIVFPSLKVSKWSSHSDLVDYFPLLDTIQGCFSLTEVDLSGSLRKNNLVNFKNLNITLSKLKTLILSKNEIESVKLIFFIYAPKLTHLDLAENRIKTIDSEIAYEYPDLTTLNIQDNELTSLYGLQHLTFLQNLNATMNKITEIPTWLLSGASNLQTLDLNNNPFQCTCKIESFRNWILSDKNTWLQPGQYVCATPDNFKGMSITAVELDCKSKTSFYLSVTIPAVLLFCVLLIILYRYRWHIKYRLFLLYRNYHQFPNNDEDFELLQLQYHAYVAYNENSAEDDAWVMNELQPNMEEGPEPLRLCIKVETLLQDIFC